MVTKGKHSLCTLCTYYTATTAVLGSYLSSLYSKLTLYLRCGLAYPYDWRGFVGAKKNTRVGLVVSYSYFSFMPSTIDLIQEVRWAKFNWALCAQLYTANDSPHLLHSLYTRALLVTIKQTTSRPAKPSIMALSCRAGHKQSNFWSPATNNNEL